jgi:hypothetical protein
MTGTPLRVAAFAGGLVLAFGAAFAIGATATSFDRGSDEHSSDMGGMAMTPTQLEAGTLPGLAVSEAGYTFVPTTTTLTRGTAVPFAFEIAGPTGTPLTGYETTHTKDLHLIVVRRDLTGFQHVHPTRDGDGTWSVPLDLGAGGTYRAYADFRPAGHGESITLGVDLQVPGAFTPVPLPAPAVGTTVDGYDVALRGSAEAGRESNLTFTVSRDGKPVDELEPYLGAFGHLVSLRTGDLAYLHTHPALDAKPGDTGGPDVTFMTEFATAGSYRLFLDFSAGGQVHTAEFTLAVGAPGDATPTGRASTAPHMDEPHMDEPSTGHGH